MSERHDYTEMPAKDTCAFADEPLTVEWLHSIGFSTTNNRFDLDDTFFLYWSNFGGTYHVELCAEKIGSTESWTLQRHYTTTEQVIALIKAFGKSDPAIVALHEQANQ